MSLNNTTGSDAPDAWYRNAPSREEWDLIEEALSMYGTETGEAIVILSDACVHIDPEVGCSIWYTDDAGEVVRKVNFEAIDPTERPTGLRRV